MQKLFTLGCSFTAEYAPIGQDNYISNYDRYKEWKGGYLPDVWPTLLGKMLGCETVNLAGAGGSNYKMIHSFIDNFDSMEENDIVIIGWTGVERFFMIDYEEGYYVNVAAMTIVDNPYISVSTQEEILFNRTHPFYAQEIRNQINFLIKIAELKKIKLYNWTSDDRIFSKLSDFVDEKNYILPPIETDYINLIQYMNNKDFYGGEQLGTIEGETRGVIPDCHLGELGHKTQAEFFYKHITKYL
jgi:hypothetical protein